MVAKPQIDGTARGRAGVPLARAQRLAQKAEAKSQQSGSRLPVVGLVLAAVALGGIWFTYSETANTPEIVATNPPVAVAQTNENPAATVSEVAVQEDINDAVMLLDEAPQWGPRPVLASCVRRIEGRLQNLYDADMQNAEWAIKRQLIRDTVQSVLDCDTATFVVEGDSELASTDLAALQVIWDRAAVNLKLTIVDSIPQSADEVVYTEDGQPIAFLVH